MIQEIEFEKSSLAVSVFAFVPDLTADVLAGLMADDESRVSLIVKRSGFADVESFGEILRGSYVLVVEEAVEDLQDGMIVAKTVHKATVCHFLAGNGRLYVWGDGKAKRNAASSIEALDDVPVVPVVFSSEDLVRFQHRLSLVSAIAVKNPKTNEVRRVRLSGKVEDYSTCNVLDPCNHAIESVAGVIEHTTHGKVKVTVGTRAAIRIGLKVGAVIDLDFLGWLVGRVADADA
jgi:hypothetical protein